VVLVGDAAYCASPASGAGALLALTGAYRLAGELATHGISSAALSRFEAAQRPLVAQKQKQLFTGLSTPRTRLGIITRNWLLSPPLNALISRMQGKHTPADIHDYRFPIAVSSQSEGATRLAIERLPFSPTERAGRGAERCLRYILRGIKPRRQLRYCPEGADSVSPWTTRRVLMEHRYRRAVLSFFSSWLCPCVQHAPPCL